MSKRNNITYIKPQDPSFLVKLKAQIGYKEGPTVDTKRQRLDEVNSDDEARPDRPEREDEKPQIVVIKSGDLSAEQVAAEEQRIAKALTEEAEKPADLNQPIVFKKRQTKKSTESEVESNKAKTSKKSSKEKTNKSKASSSSSSSKSKLSFNEDEEDEEY